MPGDDQPWGIRMKGWTIILGAAMLLATFSGCTSTFQGNQLDSVSGYPSVQHRKTIYANLVFAGKLNGEPWTRNDAQNQAYLEQRCLDLLEACGMFSFVSGDLKHTDLHLNIAVINEKETSGARQTLSALTLFLVPYRSTDTFRMLAVVKDPATGKEVRFTIQDSVNHRQHLFLVPFFPFKGSGNEIGKCTDRILENLCLEIQRAGMVE